MEAEAELKEKGNLLNSIKIPISIVINFFLFYPKT